MFIGNPGEGFLHGSAHQTHSRLMNSLQKLSSGSQFATVGEDPANLGISSRFEAQVRRQSEFRRVITNSLAMLDTASAYLQETSQMIQRMSELSISAADSSLDSSMRGHLNTELQELKTEISRISSKASYNGLSIMSGDNSVSTSPTPSSSTHSHTTPSFSTAILGATAEIGAPLTYLDPHEDEEDPEHQETQTNPGDPTPIGYSTIGTPIAGSGGTIPVSWSIVSSLLTDGALTGVTASEITSSITEVLDVWDDASPFVFTQVADSGPDPLTNSDTNYFDADINAYPMMRFGLHMIDGPSNTLAHAFAPEPNAGIYTDVHYDTSESWNVGMFLEVTLHEVGHALGMGHSAETDAIMYAYFSSHFDNLGDAYISPDDIAGIQSMYGTATNTPPEIVITGSGLSYPTSSGAAIINSDITLIDGNSANFDSGTLTVGFQPGADGNDTLAIQNVGSGAGEIGVSGSNITYEGTTIGTFVGGTDGFTPLVVTFNSNAHFNNVSELMRNITYRNDSIASTDPSRTVTFQVDDGDGVSSTSSVATYTITPINAGSLPLIGFGSSTLSYDPGSSARVIDSAVTTTYSGTPNFDFGTLTVTLTNAGTASDRLTVRNQGAVEGKIFIQGGTTIGRVVNGIGKAIGTMSGGTNGSTPLVISLQPNLTQEDVEALMRNVTYENTSSTPDTTTRTVEFELIENGAATTTTASKSINLGAAPANSAPSITLPTATLSYTAGDGALAIDSSATATDSDSADLDTGTLTVTISANGTGNDRLSVENQGSGAGQIALSGNDISYEGTVIASLTGGSNGSTPLVITFDSDATPTSAQALLRAITYENVSGSPNISSRTINFVLADGDGGTSSTVSATVNLSLPAANTKPILTAPGAAITYTENDPATIIDSNATVIDADSLDFNTGTLTIDFTTGGTANDSLSIQNQGTGAGQIGTTGNSITYEGTAIGTFSGGTDGSTPLVISLNSNATPTSTQALMRAATYANSSDNPDTTQRSIRFVLVDGDGGDETSDAVTQVVNITAVNDAPTITLSSSTYNYTAGDGTVALNSSATTSDPDSSNFDTGNLTITISSGGSSNDALSIQNQGTGAGQIGVSGSNITYSGTTIGTFTGGENGSTPLVITLNSNANATNTQALTRAITYNNSSTSPDTTTRTLQFTLNDGNDTSNTATLTLNVATESSTTSSSSSTTSSNSFQLTADGLLSGITTGDVRLSTLGIETIDATTIVNAMDALDKLEDAHQTILNQQTTVQVQAARLHFIHSANQYYTTQLSSAFSRMSETEVSSETAKLTQLIAQNQIQSTLFSKFNNIQKNILNVINI